MSVLITTKTRLQDSKPYPQTSVPDYLAELRASQDEIHYGVRGIYLAREILFDQQQLYFLYLDIDGEGNGETERIESAIARTMHVLAILRQLECVDAFTCIATGGTGFHLVSNILLNRRDYNAFAKFVEQEIPYIDLQPLHDLTQPHQMLVYKGDPGQKKEDFVHRHSEVISMETMLMTIFEVEDYRECTIGFPDPVEYIGYIQSFLQFKPVADVSILKGLGQKIKEYSAPFQTVTLSQRDLSVVKQCTPTVSLEAMKAFLHTKGILCTIEQRGYQLALSFQGLPCPVCGKTSSNARAYPPYYRLYCYNTHCRARGGLPASEWAGIQLSRCSRPYNGIVSSPVAIPATLPQVQAMIEEGLSSPEDTFLIVTPGAGKTHMTLQYLVEKQRQQVILYSCLNKDLKYQAYDLFLELGADPDHAYTLHARDEVLEGNPLCQKRDELERITRNGFSPGEILCPSCTHRPLCLYYRERSAFQAGQPVPPGVYFVTHAMLPYLRDRIQNVDLLVLDENLLKGFLMEDRCSREDLLSLKEVLDEKDMNLIQAILQMGESAVICLLLKGSVSALIQGKEKLSSEVISPSILSSLGDTFSTTIEDIQKRIRGILRSTRKYPNPVLEKKRVNAKAIRWLEGLIEPGLFSYLQVNSSGIVSYATKWLSEVGYAATPVKVLDATGNVQVASRILGRPLKAIAVDVQWQSKRVHYKYSISRSGMSRFTLDQLKKLLQSMLGEVSAQKILLISYKFLMPKILQVCKELSPKRDFQTCYYFGPRGSNHYQNCGAVLALGLPYENLNNCWYNTRILFPQEDDPEVLNSWVERNMQDELIQILHRIRPVRKEHVEIVIASKYWPEVLPEPHICHDASQNEHWFLLTVQRLDPWVKALGFLTPDLLYLNRIEIHKRGDIAEKFRSGVFNLIQSMGMQANSNRVPRSKGDSWDDPIVSLDTVDPHMISKQIFCISIYILKKHLSEHPLIRQVFTLLDSHNTERNSFQSNFRNQQILLSTNQWKRVLVYFSEKNPHFENFTLKLPHCRNQKVNGIGLSEKVIDFYQLWSELGVIPPFNPSSYRIQTPSTLQLPALPPGYLVIHTLDKQRTAIALQERYEILWQVESWDESEKNSLLQDVHTVISHDGKRFAKIFSAWEGCVQIHDLCQVEKIIRNQGVNQPFTLNKLFKQYGLLQDANFYAATYQMFQVYEEQSQLLQAYRLHRIVELEMKVVWIVAEMEAKGIGIDVHGLQTLKDTLQTPAEEQEIHLLQGVIRLLQMTQEDQRVYDTINCITATGRFGSRLHNLDRRFRKYFIPQPGNVFVIADYAQFEARVMAGLSNCSRAKKIFQSGKDLFVELARICFPSNSDSAEPHRDVFKIVAHILNNGGNRYGIQSMLNDRKREVSTDEIERFIKEYHRHFPEIRAYQMEALERARGSGVIVTPMGRSRRIRPEDKDTSIIHFPVQGSASDGFKVALVNLHRALKGLDARIVHTIHDEIIVEAKSSLAEPVSTLLRENMEQAFQDIFPGLPFTVEIRVADRWDSSVSRQHPSNFLTAKEDCV